MAVTTKKVYYNGVNYLKLPGVSGNIIDIQIDAHGGGGGGTVPIGSKVGATGGFGGYLGAMFGVPGGAELHIGVGGGGGVGQVASSAPNPGVIAGWQNSDRTSTCSGGPGGNGRQSDNSVQGGGGGALTTVAMTYPSALYSVDHTYASTAWPVSSGNPVQSRTLTPLIWAGGGGGAPGANNTVGGDVLGKVGSNALVSYIHGRAQFPYYGSRVNGDLINTPQTGTPLWGDAYGGGGTGGAADSEYGEFTGYYYAKQYWYNGGGRTYYYGQTSAYGGAGGKSGLNGYYTSTVTWHDSPELFPGGGLGGTFRGVTAAGVSSTYSISWRSDNDGMNNGKTVINSLSQYGVGGPISSNGGPGRVTVRYVQLSGQPNEIDSFLSDYDVETDTFYTTRNTVTILGINKAVPATVSDTDSQIIVNGNLVLVGTTVQVTNGAVLSLRVRSPMTFNTTKEVYLTVGDPGVEVQTRYVMITKDTPPAFANPWDFTDVTNALPNTFVTSESVEITGLATGSAPVTISATDSATGAPFGTDKLELIINNVKRETLTGVIYNGEPIKVRVKASPTPGDVVTVLIAIGDSSAVDWRVTTVATIDTSPEFYNFTNITDASGGAEVESNTVIINGINYTAVVSATAKVIETNAPVVVYASVNGESWKNLSTETVTIENQQTLQLKLTTPNVANTTVLANIEIGTNSYGSLTDEWRVTTSKAGDIIPDNFSFTDRPNQKSSTVVYSNSVLIKGITSASPLSITIPSDFVGSQAQFSIDNGDTWYNITGPTHPVSPAPQTISNNTALILKLRTGGYGSNASLINVDIGGVTDQWSVSTLPEAPVSDQTSTWYSNLTKADGYSIGTVISVFRDSSGSFGILDGSPESRYPGFIECKGQSLSAVDYPELFNVLQNTYGGNATRSDEPPYEYTGTFKLPDYRNRKLYGTGKVDFNVSSSPSVPVMFGPDGLQGGTPTTVGSQGGWWYIDKLDASGPYPREQIYDDEISGEFFRLGTLRTSGYKEITGQTGFIITGDCSGEVGPLRETIVKTPSHSHEFVSSQVLDTKNGLIAWGSPGVLSVGTATGGNNVSSLIPGASNLPSQGPFTSKISYTYTFNNYWASEKSSNIALNNSNNSDAPGAGGLGGGTIKLGAFDATASPATILGFSPGATLSHSHYITRNPPGASIFSYGNTNGPGTIFGSGSAVSETINVSFSASGLALSSDLGTFTLSSSKSINPTAKFRANETVPLITKYYRAKYIIKAF